jgi:hypothetical protein
MTSFLLNATALHQLVILDLNPVMHLRTYLGNV